MKFMMLMIPVVYRDNKELPATFAPDRELVEKMTKYNEDFAKGSVVKI
jgi:hypothetical protein